MVNLILFVSRLIVPLCVFLVITAVLFDFLEFNEREGVKKKKKSIVATGSMFLFFFFFYTLLRFSKGIIIIESVPIKIIFLLSGFSLMVFGTVVNIKGRLDLGKNWSNHIKIYGDHELVQRGAYKIVRHPLYASLIWMFFGASLIYHNYLAFLANLLIFMPFMYYRAKQEENMLAKEFPFYDEYRGKTGMFFPKIIEGRRK